MDAASQVQLPSTPRRVAQDASRPDLESFDEELVTTDRATAAANYRGIAPSLFFAGAAAFALTAGFIAASITVAVMALELGSMRERYDALNGANNATLENYGACTRSRMEAEARLKTYSELLDRVVPGSQRVGVR